MFARSELLVRKLKLVNHPLGIKITRLQAQNIAAGLNAIGNRRASASEQVGAKHARQGHAWRQADEVIDQWCRDAELIVLQMPSRQQQPRENITLWTVPELLADGQQIDSLPRIEINA
ncbi:MAG: hypothetical protein JF612_10435, partial [Planctomycetia bacterium]|nr:hypothetical protein [Planctomycetia bacterium]